jgi:hypothetical protein
VLLMDEQQKQKVRIPPPQTSHNGHQAPRLMGMPTNSLVPQTGMPPQPIPEPEYPSHILPGGRAQKAALGMARSFQVSMFQIALETYRDTYANELLFQAGVNFLGQLDNALAQIEWVYQSRQRLPAAQKVFEEAFAQTAARLLTQMQLNQTRLGTKLAELCANNLADGRFNHRGFVVEFFEALLGHDK